MPHTGASSARSLKYALQAGPSTLKLCLHRGRLSGPLSRTAAGSTNMGEAPAGPPPATSGSKLIGKTHTHEQLAAVRDEWQRLPPQVLAAAAAALRVRMA